MMAYPCTMFPGGFSGEIGFEIEADGGKHKGLASRRYFWKQDGSPLGKGPLTGPVPGFVAVRILGEGKGDSILVSIPDGEVVNVKSAEILPLAEAAQNVPIGSRFALGH